MEKNKVELISNVLQSILENLLKVGYSCSAAMGDEVVCICTGQLPAILPPNIDRAYLVCLSDQDRALLVNLAVATYLDEWLENDENAKETLRGFSLHGFNPTKKWERYGFDTDPVKEAKRQKLVAAERKYRDMMILQKEQSLKEGYPRKEDAFNIVDEQGNPKSPNGGIYYSFPTLSLIDWISEDKFLFYDLLIYRKDLLKVRDSRPVNDPLRESYREYFDAVSKLKEEPDDRIYTISAIMLNKIEPTFFHMISAFLALDVVEPEKMSMETAMNNTIVQWGRWLYFEPFCQHPIHDINRNSLCFQTLKCMAIEDNPSHHDLTLCKCILMRALLSRMLIGIKILPRYNPCLIPSWTPTDYSHAAYFFGSTIPSSKIIFH